MSFRSYERGYVLGLNFALMAEAKKISFSLGGISPSQIIPPKCHKGKNDFIHFDFSKRNEISR